MPLYNNANRDTAANQLLEFAKKHENEEEKTITTNSGNPHPYKNASLTVGPKGPVLLQDWFLIDELAHFDRERIPERVVHAKGAGAFGYFEVTHDITQYSAAKVFSEISKKTPIAVRFSQVSLERGSADTVRDTRGFAIKFYTEDGIWDLVGNNFPVFFVRDSINFPSFIHVLKRNPVTNLRDWDAFWDFFTRRPETTHGALMLLSDRGIPRTYRHQHGYGVNTFSLINKFGNVFYCKFHYKTDQGIQNILSKEAARLSGDDTDYYVRDLYNSIASGNFPSWTFYVQIMTPEQANTYKYDPFDATKVWLHADFPLIPVGRLVLNKNPINYFAEIEQIAFNVAHLIPGINASPDRMLHGRLFSYGDTHRYRLGTNYLQIPVNSPYTFHNYNRDGESTIESQNGVPNYHPNSFKGPEPSLRAKALSPVVPVVGNVSWYDTGDEDNYSQATLLYRRVLKPDERARLINNIVDCLKNASTFLQERTVEIYSNVDQDFGRRIKEGLLAAQQISLTTHVEI